MTVTAAPESARVGPERRSFSALAGTGSLVRFILRRDRTKLGAWLVGLTVLLLQLVSAASGVLTVEENQEDVRRFMEGTTGAIFGPGYGRDDITPELYVAGVYGLVFYVLAALMSMQLVARHTRAEEQSGRAELVRANVVGRDAPLTAALVVAIGANGLLALLLAGTMAVRGYDVGQGLLFGAGVGAVGLVFAGVAATTVQLTGHSRTGSSVAGMVLGAAWLVRAVGDMLRDYGSPLSWFSPLAWSNQTRSFVDGRWWPLLLSLGLATTMAAVGYAMSSRRDVGAGMVAARAGAPAAPRWLRSPVTAAFRLQRASLIGWMLALAAFGFVFGGTADQIADPEGVSEDRIEYFGGSLDTLVDGYLGIITMLTAVLAGIMVVLGVQALRSEETRGRLEPVLATATSRWAWFGGHLVVLGLGLVALLGVVGLATGLGAALSVGDGSYVGILTVAHVAHAPGLLVVLGVAALLYGVLPRAVGATWIVLGYGLFLGLFGAVVDHPRWLRNLLPMEHTGHPPLDDVSWSTLAVLVAIAGGLIALGLAAFRRRDLASR